MNKGFTLIELLVVVLIIGILAAIALPQYQKAVERSRIAEAVQTLGDWAQAQSIYYMQHNAFAEDINEGDITLPTPGDSFDYDQDGDVDWAELMAERNAGLYAGGRLLIGVENNGTIYKLCDGPEGFCPLTEASGYIPQEISWAGDEDLGGGGSGGGGKICPLPQPECAYGYDTTTCSCKMKDGGGIVLTPGDEFIISPGGGTGGGSGNIPKCKILGTC